MKTKLLFSSTQKLKNGIKPNGIFTFLIIFFMTVSSFGQGLNGQYGIVFELCGATITFEAPTITPGQPYVYPIGTAVFPGGSQHNWELVYEGAGTPTISWALKGPTDQAGTGPRVIYYFILESSVCSNAIYPSNDINPNCWQEQISCGGLTSIIYTEPSGDSDNDGDGFPASVDCNDNDDSIFPGATEVCDEIDNNCDTFIDEGFDADGDGFSTCSGDCDDLESTVYPGAEEICDGLDNDCDGIVDEDILNCDNGVILEYCNDEKTKILVCHNGKDICVSINAKDAHEAHGDYIGSCANASREVGIEISEENPGTYDVVSWPNPTNNFFHVRMITPNYEDNVNIQAFDINGRLIHSNIINGNEDYQFGTNLQSGIYFVKVTQANTINVIKVIKR